MTKIELVGSFLDIDPKVDIKARDIQLLCVDIENVLTDYGIPQVLPGIAEHMEELKSVNDKTQVVLITNKTDPEFIENVVSQLPGDIDYLYPNKTIGLKRKPSPDMFRFALDKSGVLPTYAAHIDDQSKAWWGSSKAKFETFFWVEPIGEFQHPKVKKLRPLEFGLVRPLVNISNDVREILAGDW